MLVSIAYRVGQLGFLAHADLSVETKTRVSGNYGLLDIIAGLEWIQKNIAVNILCASPLAKGLFGAISQSGGSFGPPRPMTFPGENLKRLPDAEKSGAAYARSIAETRQLSVDKLPAGGRGMGGSWPIIDGYVIPDDQLYEAKRYNDNGEGVPAWPAFSDANPAVMHFAGTPHTGPVPSAEALRVLDAYFAWRRTPEGEAFVNAK